MIRVLVVAVLLGCPLIVQAGAEALEQALAASKRTGRPLLAVRTGARCIYCQQLKEELNTSAPLRPLLAQFVRLEVPVEDHELDSAFVRVCRPEGNGIPQVYVIRSDGERLLATVGKPKQVGATLTGSLANAGRPLDEATATKMAAVGVEAAKAIEAGQPGAAIAKLLKFAGSNSFAEPAVKVEKLLAALAKTGAERLHAAEEDLKSDDKRVAAALELAGIGRIYAKLPALKKEVAAALGKLRRDPATHDLLAAAESFDAAREAEAKDPKKAAALYDKLAVGDAPEALKTQAAERRAKLAVAKADSADGGEEAKPATGEAKKAASLLRLAKVSAARKPELARKYAEQVIELAPDGDLAKQAQALLATLPEG